MKHTKNKKSNLLGESKNWFICDFETITHNTNFYEEHGHTDVLLAHSVNFDASISQSFANIKDGLDGHIAIGKNQTIFFHNLSFDGIFILQYLLKIGYKPKLNKSDNVGFEVFANGMNLYWIRLWLKRRINGRPKHYSILFRCSYKMLNTAVMHLGQSFGLDKHEEDDELSYFEDGRVRAFYDREPKNSIEDGMKTPRDRRYLQYCQNDCEIVRRALNEFRECVNHLSFVKYTNNRRKTKREVNKHYRGKDLEPLDHLTSASLTYNLMEKAVEKYKFTKNIKKAFYPLVLEKETGQAMRLWFKGGFTQFNDEYDTTKQDTGNSMMIDVSSAYPFQMTKPLPYGKIYEERPMGVEGKDYYRFIYAKCRGAKIKKEYGNMPIMINGNKVNKHSLKSAHRYVRKIDKFECYYTSFEGEFMKKIYDIRVDYYGEGYMLAKPYLQEYANELYDLKTHYSQTGQKGMKQCMKILLNAGYGCLAKRMRYDKDIFITPEQLREGKELTRHEEIDGETKKYIFNFIKNVDVGGNLIRVNLTPQFDSKSVNVAAASVITSLQRVYLGEKILEVGASHFAYSDTDSIIFTNLDDEQFQKMKEEYDRPDVKLGDGEREFKNYTIKQIIVFGAKKYALFDEFGELIKFRFAGVSTSLINPKYLVDEIQRMNSDQIMIANATLTKYYDSHGIILLPKNKLMKVGTI